MNQGKPLKPYVGLIPFEEEDANFFFGRQQERDIIISNLMASRLTLLYGESGVGKSSVLRAGVAHRLREFGQRNRKRRRSGKPEFALVVFNSWRDEPLAKLLEKVGEAVGQALEGESFEPVAPDLPFVESLREWGRRVQGQLLVVLDQFEEYFLYHPNESGDGTFAAEFSRAVNTLGLPVNFLVSYREDAHAKLDFFKKSIPHVYDNCLRIGHLDYDAARTAILKPIEKYNELLGLEGDHAFNVEPELVETVLKQVRVGEKFIGEAGSGVIGGEGAGADDGVWEIETPYLQLVMERLWDETVREKGPRLLRLGTLERLGGAKSIVQTHLDNAMKGLTRRERNMGAKIFNYLVTPSGSKIAQTVPDLARYISPSEETQRQLGEMMKKLAEGQRLILRSVAPPPDQPGVARYEVFHDVLAKAILDWRRRYRVRQQMWRMGLAGGAALVLLLFMTGLTVFALQQRRLALNAAAESKAAAAKEMRQREAAVASEKLANELSVLAEGNARRAKESEEEAKKAAEKELQQKEVAERLAASNKQLADRFKAAYQAETRAKAEEKRQTKIAQDALDKVKEEKQKALDAAQEAQKARDYAEKAALEAEKQAKIAKEALSTVDEIDQSNAYYKAVMRVGGVSDLYGATFSADGARVLTVSDDGVAHVWDVNSSKEPPRELRPDEGLVLNAGFSPDGGLAVTTSNEKEALAGVATIWDLSTGEPRELDSLTVEDEQGEPMLLQDAAFSPDGNSFTAVGIAAAKVCKWNRDARKLDTNCTTLKPAVNAQSVFNRELSGDGRFFLSFTNGNREVYASDAQTGRNIKLAHPDLDALSVKGNIAFSRDGRYVATANVDNVARLFDTGTGALVAEFKGDEQIISTVSFSGDGKLLAAGSGDGQARVWKISTRQNVATLSGHRAPLRDVEFSPDGRYLVSASGDKTARVWDLNDGKMFAELRGHIAEVETAAFSGDGNFVLTSGDRTARVWNVSRSDAGVLVPETSFVFSMNAQQHDLDESPDKMGRQPDLTWRHEPKGGPGTLNKVSLDPENKAQFARFDEADPKSSDTRRGRKFEEITLTELVGLNYSGVSLGGSTGDGTDPLPVGLVFAVRTSEGNYAKVEVLERSESLKIRWVTYKNPSPQPTPTPAPTPEQRSALSVESASLLSSHPLEVGEASLADFGPGGASLVVAGAGNTAVVVKTASGSVATRVAAHGEIDVVSFSPDGARVLTADRTGLVAVWDARTGALLSRLAGHEGEINAAAFSGDGRRVATGGQDDRLRIYDAATGAPLVPPVDLRHDVNALAFSPDGRRVVTAGDDDKVRVHDSATGGLLQTLPGSGSDFRKVLFSPDGKYIASLDEEGRAGLWKPSPDGNEWQPYEGFDLTARALDLAFSPDSRWLAVPCADGKVRVWALALGHVAYLLNEIHRGDPLRRVLSFSPGGRTLLLGGDRGTAVLWNWTDISPTTFVELPGHTGPVINGSFSPDGARAYTAGADGAVRAWELKTAGNTRRNKR